MSVPWTIRRVISYLHPSIGISFLPSFTSVERQECAEAHCTRKLGTGRGAKICFLIPEYAAELRTSWKKRQLCDDFIIIPCEEWNNSTWETHTESCGDLQKTPMKSLWSQGRAHERDDSWISSEDENGLCLIHLYTNTSQGKECSASHTVNWIQGPKPDLFWRSFQGFRS